MASSHLLGSARVGHQSSQRNCSLVDCLVRVHNPISCIAIVLLFSPYRITRFASSSSRPSTHLASSCSRSGVSPCCPLPQYAGDAGWPSIDVCSTVRGRLIATLYLTAPCYGSTRDEQNVAVSRSGRHFPTLSKCDLLFAPGGIGIRSLIGIQAKTPPSQLRLHYGIQLPSSFMALPFVNEMCHLFLAAGKSCALGNLVPYSERRRYCGGHFIPTRT